MTRFTVGSVTGYTYFTKGPPFYIGDHSGSAHRRPLTTWYVYDSAFCYQPVRAFDQMPTRRRVSWWPVLQTRPDAEKKAREHAAMLNAKEGQ